jgi:hypothetical protein
MVRSSSQNECLAALRYHYLESFLNNNFDKQEKRRNNPGQVILKTQLDRFELVFLIVLMAKIPESIQMVFPNCFGINNVASAK